MSAASDKPLVAACIPLFNEERTIGSVVVRALRFVDRVVVCDDGSGDLTGEIAGGWVRVWRWADGVSVYVATGFK